MTVKRGTGRLALIGATADVLRVGGEVQVKEIAATAGVSHTLVYRHFPVGGKDELVAEAYAHLFRGLAESDIEDLFDILETSGLDRDRIRDFVLIILSPRWSRLEALAQTRTNPYVAARIEDARRDLIGTFAKRLRRVEPAMTEQSATAFSVIAQALPLGITAIGGLAMPKALREEVAGMWADTLVNLLALARGGKEPPARQP